MTPPLWTQDFRPHPAEARTPHPIFKLLKAEEEKKNLECSHLKKRHLRGKTRMTGFFITNPDGHKEVAHFSHAEKTISPEASILRNICL